MAFKRTLLIAGLLCSLAFGANLSTVKNVYLLPMPGGMDHYLAVQLTKAGFVQVVTDPSHADAVITDHIGASLEDSMNELFLPKKEKDPKDKDSEPAHARMQPLSRGKGSIFVVDRGSRVVLWSTFAPTPAGGSAQVNKLAIKVTAEMQKAWAGTPAK